MARITIRVEIDLATTFRHDADNITQKKEKSNEDEKTVEL